MKELRSMKIVMFYSQYLNDKARRNSIRNQLEKQRQKENARVTIRDLVVFPEHESESKGESNFSSAHLGIDSTTRLIDHLKSIAKIANEYHQQAIDICLDHKNLHSKRLMLAQQNFSEIDTTHFIAEQVDQILTSNSINPQGKAKITPSILHIDPDPKIFFDRDNIKRPVDKALRLDS